MFGEELSKHADKDPRIVAITAAMPSGTGLDIFGKNHPTRCFDVGIAEQHGVTFAAGLAAEGMRPFAAIYSTFLQRAYDQVVHDVAIQSLPVRFAMDRAGLVGADGPTHAGSFDITYLATLPNFVVMAPSDEVELMHMVATAVEIDDRPSSIRYPRGEGLGLERPAIGSPLSIGKGRVIREGASIALLSFGTRLAECLMAADKLSAYGLSATVADARFAKPLDEDLIRRLAREHEVLITIEEGAVGGFGSHVLQFLAMNGLLDRGLKVRPMVLPDRFLDHDTPEKMYEAAGLDANGIVATVLGALGPRAGCRQPQPHRLSTPLRILKLGHAGDGIAEDGSFVPYTAPGDVVRVEDGKLAELVTPGPHRATPVCRHFGTCGGCALQHLDEQTYRAFKRDLVIHALAQRGIENPIVGVPSSSRPKRAAAPR